MKAEHLGWLPILLLAVAPCCLPRQQGHSPVSPVPPDPPEYRVAVVGDNQVGSDVFRTICHRIHAESADLFVGLGDHVQDDTLQNWLDQWIRPGAEIAYLPRMGCVGNHDGADNYQRMVWSSEPHYLSSGVVALWNAQTVGSVRWVFLDTNEQPAIRISLQPGGSQRAWLEQEVASPEWRNARWRVVAYHHPHRTEYWEGACYFPEMPERMALVQLLRASNVSLVLNGHCHGFARGNLSPGAWYISGGGGGWLDTNHCFDWPEIQRAEPRHHFLLIGVFPTHLLVEAKNPDGSVFDTARIN